MSEDAWLAVAIGTTWGVLAVLYAAVPMFAMPGSVLVWGSGAALFLLITLLTLGAERRVPARTSKRDAAP